jgi:hypothetical protein
MKSVAPVLFVLLPLATAFTGSSSFAGASLGISTAREEQSSLTMEYIPSGMSKEQWRKVKEAEKSKNNGKNLGKTGITTFKSRSFMDWQKSGGKNLFPVDPTKVKSPKDLPYMQRPGGMPDDSDLKKPNPFSNMFSFGGKRKVDEPEPEEKKTNWWTL